MGSFRTKNIKNTSPVYLSVVNRPNLKITRKNFNIYEVIKQAKL